MEQVPLWVSLTQIGASLFVGIAGFTLAVVSAKWNYRNNFGYAPTAFISSDKLEAEEDFEETKQYFAVLRFEVWNRQKYPIFVRTMTLTFEDIQLLPVEDQQVNAPWTVGNTYAQFMYEDTLDASKHYAHTLTIPFTAPSRRALNNVAALIHIRVEYFDPRLNRSRKLIDQHRYFPVARH